MKLEKADKNFIKGNIKLKFIPHGNDDGFFEITKGGEAKGINIRKYFQFYLENWSDAINELEGEKEQAALFEDAILEHEKDLLVWTHPEVLRLIQRNIDLLKIDQRLFKRTEPEPINTKKDVFKEGLKQGGFYTLEKVKRLSEEGQNSLVELLLTNMAYGIAMFEHLGFCEYLDFEKGAKIRTNIYLSRLYNERAKDDTSARHYRNSLLNNKPRYPSYLHTEKVKKDFENLK